MILLPKLQVNKITDIKIKVLEEKNIKGLILDVDNTLIDLDKNPLDGIKEWINNVKENGIKICIASNSIKKKKVKKIANELNVPYVYFSVKPTKWRTQESKKNS